MNINVLIDYSNYNVFECQYCFSKINFDKQVNANAFRNCSTTIKIKTGLQVFLLIE